MLLAMALTMQTERQGREGGANRKLGHYRFELGGREDGGVAEVFEFGADGVQGAVGGCDVRHFW